MLKHDRSGVSELVMILVIVLAIIIVIAVIAGGSILVAALFFGGRLGTGFFLFIVAGFVYGAALYVKAFTKYGLWIGHLLVGIGLVFVILGALGR